MVDLISVLITRGKKCLRQGRYKYFLHLVNYSLERRLLTKELYTLKFSLMIMMRGKGLALSHQHLVSTQRRKAKPKRIVLHCQLKLV